MSAKTDWPAFTRFQFGVRVLIAVLVLAALGRCFWQGVHRG